MSPENILDKVRKLLKLAGNNPNPEEAATAAAMAQRLLDAHNLSAAMLELETPEATRTPEEPIERYDDAALGTTRDAAHVRLATVISRANGCRIYLTTYGRGNGRTFLVGRATDAEATRYLYAWVVSEMDRLAEAHGKGKGRVWRNNFKLGIVDTIGRKLRENRETMAAEAKASVAHNPHALMVVSQALASIESKSASVEVWMKTNMRLGAGRARGGRYDSGAREAGRRAGEAIPLRGGRPLTSGAPRLNH